MTTELPASHLLSRVAENAYWAGRYLERAEGTARLIRSHADLIIDLPRSATLGWGPLLAVLGVDADHEVWAAGTTEEDVVSLLALDKDQPGSIVSSVEAIHMNLRVTRTVMPVEASEILTELALFVRENESDATDRQTRAAWLTTIVRYCQTLSGVLTETMAHDDAYCFFVIGRQIERADLTSRVLDVQASLLTDRYTEALEPYLDISWFAALRSVSALQAFRRSGLPDTADAKVRFLLRDLKCPRTIESCLVEASRWLLELPGHSEPMASCAKAQTTLEAIDSDELVGSALHETADRIQQALAEVHLSVERTWFEAVTHARS